MCSMAQGREVETLIKPGGTITYDYAAAFNKLTNGQKITAAKQNKGGQFFATKADFNTSAKPNPCISYNGYEGGALPNGKGNVYFGDQPQLSHLTQTKMRHVDIIDTVNTLKIPVAMFVRSANGIMAERQLEGLSKISPAIELTYDEILDSVIWVGEDYSSSSTLFRWDYEGLNYNFKVSGNKILTEWSDENGDHFLTLYDACDSTFSRRLYMGKMFDAQEPIFDGNDIQLGQYRVNSDGGSIDVGPIDYFQNEVYPKLGALYQKARSIVNGSRSEIKGLNGIAESKESYLNAWRQEMGYTGAELPTEADVEYSYNAVMYLYYADIPTADIARAIELCNKKIVAANKLMDELRPQFVYADFVISAYDDQLRDLDKEYVGTKSVEWFEDVNIEHYGNLVSSGNRWLVIDSLQVGDNIEIYFYNANNIDSLAYSVGGAYLDSLTFEFADGRKLFVDKDNQKQSYFHSGEAFTLTESKLTGLGKLAPYFASLIPGKAIIESVHIFNYENDRDITYDFNGLAQNMFYGAYLEYADKPNVYRYQGDQETENFMRYAISYVNYTADNSLPKNGDVYINTQNKVSDKGLIFSNKTQLVIDSIAEGSSFTIEYQTNSGDKMVFAQAHSYDEIFQFVKVVGEEEIPLVSGETEIASGDKILLKKWDTSKFDDYNKSLDVAPYFVATMPAGSVKKISIDQKDLVRKYTYYTVTAVNTDHVKIEVPAEWAAGEECPIHFDVDRGYGHGVEIKYNEHTVEETDMGYGYSQVYNIKKGSKRTIHFNCTNRGSDGAWTIVVNNPEDEKDYEELLRISPDGTVYGSILGGSIEEANPELFYHYQNNALHEGVNLYDAVNGANVSVRIGFFEDDDYHALFFETRVFNGDKGFDDGYSFYKVLDCSSVDVRFTVYGHQTSLDLYEMKESYTPAYDEVYANYDWTNGTFVMPAANVTLFASESELSLYAITLDKSNTSNGDFSVNRTEYYETDTVRIFATPDKGFEVDKVKVSGTDNGYDYSYQVKKDDKGYFLFEDFNLTIAVTFKERTSFAVTIPEEVTGGSVSASLTNAGSGDVVTLTVTPATGFEVAEVKVTNSDGVEIPLDMNLAFTMPKDDVTVSVTFTPASVTALESLPAGNGKVEAYTLGGQKVRFGTNLRKGLYILVEDGRARKVLVK